MADARDIVIWSVVGEWGRWQRRTVFLVFLCKIISCWSMAIILFTAPTQRPQTVRCYRERNNASALFLSIDEDNHSVSGPREWHEILHPEIIAPYDKPFDIDFCDVNDDVGMHIDRDRDPESTRNDTVHCDSFKHEPFLHAKRTDFDGMCSRNIVAAFTQLFFLFGVLSGGVIAWNLLNFVSPKNLMLCGMIGHLITGLSLAFLDDYKWQLLMRYLNSVSCAQLFTAGPVILTDIIGPQHLKMVLPLFETFWSIGEISLAIITHFVHSWQGLYVAITLPTIAYMMLWYFLADSPRWHMQRGNRTHARKIISEAATINNKSSSILSNDFIDDVCIVSNDGCAMKTRMPPPTATTTEPNEDGFLSLWTCNRCINMILIHAVWGAVLCNFNGMLLNTRNFGADTLNRNVALTGVSELVGVLFAYTFIIGNSRKWLWSGLLNIGIGFAVILVFLQTTARTAHDHPNGIMMLNLSLKCVVSITFVVIVSSTTELVPSHLRASLLMSCTIWGRICLLTASFIGSLSLFTTLLPLAVFAINMTIAGFLMCAINPNVTNHQMMTAATKTIELHEVEKLTSPTR